MMHVARGRLDAYFEAERSHVLYCLYIYILLFFLQHFESLWGSLQVGIYPWDVCAGEVIVEEAGGVCVDTLGGSFDLSSRRILVAASGALAKDLATHLRRHRYDTLAAEDYEESDAKRPRT